MYKQGDKVEYKTATIKRIHSADIIGQTRIGIIEEAFHTVNKRPCYWIFGEKELVHENQILGFVN